MPKKTELILSSIVQDPILHYRFLTTLSYLEHRGACKIAYYIRSHANLELLQHHMEEARHALLFKTFLEKIGFDSSDYYVKNQMLPGPVRNYLDLLELKICQFFKNQEVADLRLYNYLFTTYLVELRANFLYPLYQKVLDKNEVNISLRGIIAEEVNHLSQIEESITKEGLEKYTEALQMVEYDLWSNLVLNLSLYLKKSNQNITSDAFF